MSQSSNIKLCECGCGEPAPIAKKNSPRDGHVKDQPTRFKAGHHSGLKGMPTEQQYRESWERQTDIPYGYCWCGCGQRTRISKQTDNRCGHVRGAPVHYVSGHHSKTPGPAYIEENRGFKVNGEPSPCWIWQKAGTLRRSEAAQGYGTVVINRKNHYAHRFYYEAKYGPIPQGYEVDHLCVSQGGYGSTRCVNPDHMEPVTRLENRLRRRDIILNPRKVRRIRKLAATKRYTHQRLADAFGISLGTVKQVIHRRTWKHVD